MLIKDHPFTLSHVSVWQYIVAPCSFAWVKELDSLNKWPQYDNINEKVMKIYCAFVHSTKKELKDCVPITQHLSMVVFGTALK